MAYKYNPFTGKLDIDSKYKNIVDGTTAGQMIHWDGSTWTYIETSEMFWDDANKWFGIGTDSPNNKLEVAGLISFDDALLNVALGTDALGSITNGDKNTAIGLSALYSATSGDGNIAIGTNSLKYVTTGTTNVAIGYNAGVGLTTGGGNIFMGYKAGTSAYSDQDSNIGIGYYTLGSTSGDIAGNLAIGYQAGRYLINTTASEGRVNTYIGYLAGTGASGTNKSSYNVGIGYLSLYNVTTGTENVALGSQSLLSNSSGSQNIAIGVDAMADNTGGVYNVAIGVDALKSNTTGVYNFALGFASLRDAVGSHNIGIGSQTLYKNTGGSNVAIGSNVFNRLTSGVGNVGIGYTACGEDTTGSYNTWVGYGAGYIQKGSNSNVAIGYRSCRGTADTGFSNNVAIGNYSGFTLSTGSGNILLGNYAGYTQTSNNYRLIVDSIQRADVATEQTNAILYGIMASTPASQSLRINAEIQGTYGSKIGDGGTTDYAQFDTDGELTLHGTARVYKNQWINVQGLKAPGTKPATAVDWGISCAWEFSNGTDDTVCSSIRIPQDMDRTVAPEFKIGFASDTNTGDVVWQIEYLYLSPNEDTTASAQETLTTTTTISATADGLTIATITGMDLPSSTDQLVKFRIKRLGSDGADTLADDCVLTGCGIKYVADKLGIGL